MIASPRAALDHAEFARAVSNPDLPVPLGLTAWNDSDPAVRFAVHRNNIHSSLIDALADNFPVVRELVGEEFFRAMAQHFVRACLPRSRLLAFYGEAFADFVAGFPPAKSLPYLPDVARLEMARVLAYHAADHESVGEQALQVAMGSGDQIAELRLQLRPSLAVVDSAYAVVSLWAAHQGLVELVDVDPLRPECALILRDELDVLVLRLAPGVAGLLDALSLGRGLGDAASRALSEAPLFDLAAALALLLRHGAVVALYFPRSAHS